MALPAEPEQLQILDAHQHVWDISARPQPWLDSAGELAPLRRSFSLADLRPLASRAGVAGSVVVQTVTSPAETPELLELARAGDFVLAVVGWTELTDPAVGGALSALQAGPGGGALAGIRHPLLAEPDPRWLERPEVLRGLRAVAAAGLCFDLVLPPALLPSATLAAARVPGLTFVLDHLGNVEPGPRPDETWASQLREFARLPNTAAKLSGILGDVVRPAASAPADIPASAGKLRQYFEIALAAFGPQRLMFGSDWPVCTLSAGYGEVVAVARALAAGLSPAEQAALLGGTARAVYRIA
jgi:L-fuconolactonase